MSQTGPINIDTHNEWDSLQVVIVGRAIGARVPTRKDRSLHCVDYAQLSDEEFARVCTGPYPQRVVEETEEDLELLCESLRSLGIMVLRPATVDFSEMVSNGCWKVDGYHAYCPRDTLLTVGNRAIKTPMALRHRQREARIYSQLVQAVEAPTPRLLDSIYDRSIPGVPTLRNDEPVFDAANCLKLGRDILYLISNTGNQAGADWLQQHLGDGYRVHTVRDVYAFVHIDSTIVPLRPGLVLLCPTRVNDSNLPELLRGWDRIYAPEPNDMPYEPEWNPASNWIALNCLSISPEVVVVEQRQTRLMRVLERHGIEPLPVRLRHMRTLGGGPHCVTLDLVRNGSLEDYSS